MTTVAALVCLILAAPTLVAPPGAPAAQVEIDRILVRVNGHIITTSDVRQARALRLVDDVSSEAAVQRALENRLLILGEMARAAPAAPPREADVAARRTAWITSLGAGADVPGLLAKGGMSEAELQAWLTDDVRVAAYLQRQFGMLPGAERVRATDEWINRLRQRADLH
jgi:hypothetical protein